MMTKKKCSLPTRSEGRLKTGQDGEHVVFQSTKAGLLCLLGHLRVDVNQPIIPGSSAPQQSTEHTEHLSAPNPLPDPVGGVGSLRSEVEEDDSPGQEDEERPKPTCADEAVITCFLCGGRFVKLLTRTLKKLSSRICSPPCAEIKTLKKETLTVETE